jgi:microcystin-dependent protein
MLFALIALGFGDTPGFVPLHGLVTGPNGGPLHGSRSLTVRLYADAGAPAPEWSETVVVHFEDGAFATRLGTASPLDLDVFGALSSPHITVQLAGEAESQPAPVDVAPIAAWSLNAGRLVGRDGDRFFHADDGVPWSALTGRPEPLTDTTSLGAFVAAASFDTVDELRDALNTAYFERSIGVPWTAVTGSPASVATEAALTTRISQVAYSSVSALRSALDGVYLSADNPTAATDTVLPAGLVMPYAGGTVPSGFLLCDGASVSRTAYPRLFTAIGCAHGCANGTSFNLPDYRGLFLRGVDGGAGRDPGATSRTAANAGGNTGNNVGSFQADGFASHTHTADNSGSHSHTVNAHDHGGGNHRHEILANGGNPSGPNHQWLAGNNAYPYNPGWNTSFSGTIIASQSPGTDAQGSHSHTIGSAGSGDTRPKNAYVLYLIKL